jgi:hypothetical protein
MQKILMALLVWVISTGALASPAALLVYQVWEQGAEPYVSRIMVTPDYVRLDEGDDAGGYTLFDRRQEILYNVDDRSVLVMNPTAPVPEDNQALILQEQVKPDEQAPRVAGQQPQDVKLYANGELCSELVVVEGVMQEAVDGLAELKLVLARIQAATLDAMPLETRTPCDMAGNLYAPDRSLRFGLPLQERSEGRSQSLVDFIPDRELPDVLFTLPEQFCRRPMFAPGEG